jgi:plastocyanin
MKQQFSSPRSGLFWGLLLASLIASMASAGTLTATVTDAGGSAVADAVIALYDGKPLPTAAPQATLDQRNKQFDPQVLAIRTHTSVRFPNSDDIHHEVYSFSKAKPFELPLYHGTSAAPVTFDKPGAVVLGCNIHDNMIAYIYVVDSPWFGKTDAAGKVTIGDVPAGKYRARLWYPGLSDAAVPIEQEVAVTASGLASITFNNAQREVRAGGVKTLPAATPPATMSPTTMSPTTTSPTTAPEGRTRSWGERRAH